MTQASGVPCLTDLGASGTAVAGESPAGAMVPQKTREKWGVGPQVMAVEIHEIQGAFT